MTTIGDFTADADVKRIVLHVWNKHRTRTRKQFVNTAEHLLNQYGLIVNPKHLKLQQVRDTAHSIVPVTCARAHSLSLSPCRVSVPQAILKNETTPVGWDAGYDSEKNLRAIQKKYNMTHASMPSLDDGFTRTVHQGSISTSATTVPYVGLGHGASHRQIIMMTGHLADIAQSLRALVSICGGSRESISTALGILRSDLADSDASEEEKSEEEEEEAPAQEDDEQDETDSKSQSSSRDERARKRARAASPSVEVIDDDEDMEDADAAAAAAPASSLHTAVSLPSDIPAAAKTAKQQQKQQRKNGNKLGARHIVKKK